MKNTLPLHASNNPTTATSPSVVFRGSVATNSAAIYRSLEVPLPATSHSPLAFPSNLKAGFPIQLKQQQTKSPGQVSWTSVEVITPPLPGLFVFSSNCFQIPLANAVQNINKALEANLVDVTMYRAFEWTCSLLADFVETQFVLRLFHNGNLDFQRECGCPFQFNQVYSNLQSSLVGKQQPTMMKAKGFKPLALPKEMEEEKHDVNMVEIKPLVEVCCSIHVDVQQQGLTTLSHVLSTKKMEEAMANMLKQRLLDLLVQTKDVQVKRLTVTCLNLLCCQQQALSCCKQEEVNCFINLLLDEKEMVETRRQVGKTMSHFAKGNPSAFKSNTKLFNKLICQDAQLNEVVNGLRQMLSV